jgi:hypothetical protein
MADPHPRVRGDFQTPVDLARQVWAALGDLGDVGAVVEPTVGAGSFLISAPTELRARPWVCFDINAEHVATAAAVAAAQGFEQARITKADAFTLAPASFADLDREQPLLAIGNPPWVTSSGQASVAARNLPLKSNATFGLAGLDALTGKANFDIAEAVLLRLLEATESFEDVRLAFLIKRTVAMKLARRLLGVAHELSFAEIDARGHFGVAVDAGLFIARRKAGAAPATHVSISPGLGKARTRRAGLHNERFVEDLDAHAAAAHLEAVEPVPWRQGVKHDLAKILELTPGEEGLRNGLGEAVEIEEEALCPLYKSSDVANGRAARRLFPLFQEDLSGPLPDLESRWPLLAAYLRRHGDAFDARRSRIYARKPRFSIFGIGPYTLAPWKVAVSGLYSSGRFRVIGPDENGRPSLVDDTCYLLPFDNERSARTVADHLNGAEAQRLLRTLMDPGSKRPVTKAILSRVEVPIEPSEERNGPAPLPKLPVSA